MLQPKSISIVIPVYNEEKTLKYTLDRLLETLPLIQLKTEFVFVNDGSSDGSQILLDEFYVQSLSQSFAVKNVTFSRNFGHAAAVLAGVENSSSDLIAIIDADLQDPPELIPQMVEQLVSGSFDVVYGRRIERKGETAFKKFTAWAFYRIINLLTGVEIPSDTGDFRVMTAEVKEAVLQCREHDPFLRGLVAWVGFRQSPFLYKRDERRYGNTKYPFRKMFRFALMAITSFSSKPLYLALGLGGFGFLGSVCVFLWAGLSWLSGGTVPGWASLLISFSIFQSLTILLLGVQGSYIARIYSETINRPRYLVKKNDKPQKSCC